MLTMASRLQVMQRLGRAMADPTRSRILSRLLDGPCNPAQLARDLQLTPSNVSNHLTCLRGCGLVVVTPQGRKASYEIADPHLVKALTALVDIVLAVDDGRPCADADCDVPLCCGPGALETARTPQAAPVADGTEPADATGVRP
ncbi:winged helix-turn-helix transcriptional regulator [Quadrisphaera setariae]|uniref:Winged helix-turn-helix transcriptional regulator n=1 Tax=Quadrisphaera setariae TaxID=2593304 RepID=A0A5C8Z5F4_9ACTN|nr:winged helix-turn-helix transcriptional regulator [Streptomyces sp. NP160]TXR52418.1 winged helix-turn-helix transcriptional regulator [Quadrisphaera setariae]